MKKASTLQISFIYLISAACYSAYLLPSAVSNYAGKFSFIVSLILIPLAFLFAKVLNYVIEKYGSFKKMVSYHFGTRASNAIGFIILIWLCAFCVFYTAAFYDRLSSTAFSYIPRWVCISALVLVSALFCLDNKKSIGRSGEVIFIILAVTVAVLLLFSAKGIKIETLLPVNHDGFTRLLRSFLFPMGLMGFVFFFTYFFEGKKSKKNYFSFALIGGNVLLSVFIIVIESVFGSELSAKISYPFFALIKSTDTLIKLEHFESLISGVWIVISICFFICVLSVISDAVEDIFKLKEKNRTELIKLLPPALILLISLLIPENRFFNEYVLSVVFPLGNTLLGIILPCMFLLTKRE